MCVCVFAQCVPHWQYGVTLFFGSPIALSQSSVGKSTPNTVDKASEKEKKSGSDLLDVVRNLYKKILAYTLAYRY